MIRALYSAATGMEAQQTNIEIISNNIANVNTAGYKKRRGLFEDLLYQNLLPAGAAASANK
jgi:flagellar basal-body rod protein FlgG